MEPYYFYLILQLNKNPLFENKIFNCSILHQSSTLSFCFVDDMSITCIIPLEFNSFIPESYKLAFSNETIFASLEY